MQNAFTDGFRQYLSRHHREIARDPHALALIQPLYGLADTATYESWKLSNDLRYYEASNLVHELLSSTTSPVCMQELALTLESSGYDDLFNRDFDRRIVTDQVRLIYKILTARTGSLDTGMASTR